MKSLLALGLVALLAACSPREPGSTDSSSAKTGALASAAVEPDPCKPPTTAAAMPEESAWRLFVAAVCPVNANQYPFVVWENWIEQNDLYNPGGPKILRAGERPRFHGSPLRAFLQAQAAARRTGAKAIVVPDLATIAAQNCTPSQFGRMICEETRINPEAQKFITDNGLTTRAGQVKYAAAGKSFEFPAPAVEVKVDWIKLGSCNNPPKDVHVEKVGNECFALAGMHLISKLIDKWIWATFEPQNSVTNPRRCQAIGCNDGWGSSPATSSGGATQLTPVLASLMTAAKLAPEWRNYRLAGAQVDFLDASGKPTLLGNSIIEGENAAGPEEMKLSSCITCHQFSTIRADGKPAMGADFKVGNPLPLPAGMISRDFVWSFALAR